MSNDPRDLTIRELCALAAQVRKSVPETREYRQRVERMATAALYLYDAGALSQMIWWMRDIEPEAPPDGKARVIELRPGPSKAAVADPPQADRAFVQEVVELTMWEFKALGEEVRRSKDGPPLVSQ